MEILQIIAQVVLWSFTLLVFIGSLFRVSKGGIETKCRVKDGVLTLVGTVFITVPLYLLAFGYFI